MTFCDIFSFQPFDFKYKLFLLVLDHSMVLKLLPGHSTRGGGGVLEGKGDDDKKREDEEGMEKEKEDKDPIIETLGEIGR